MFEIDFRVVLPAGWRYGHSQEIEESIWPISSSDPTLWKGEDVVAFYFNYTHYGDPYPYSFKAPTAERLNQWWAEGVRKFVLHDGLGHRIRFRADIRRIA